MGISWWKGESMSDTPESVRTSLYDRHLAHGAKMVDFHGFRMPVQYSGIQEEHRRVRTGVGMFDISHMGEIEIWGQDAYEYVQRVITNDAGRLKTFQVQYTGL